MWLLLLQLSIQVQRSWQANKMFSYDEEAVCVMVTACVVVTA